MSTQTGVRIGFLVLIALLDGMADSCLGPALRDLQCIYNVTLQRVSLLHPVVTAGRVVGSLLFLKIPRHFNIYGVAATTIITTCCSLASMSVIPMFGIALVLTGAAGLANGITIHALILLSGELSTENAASIHIINLAMTAGQFAGPLVISQFVSDNIYHLPMSSIDNGSVFNYTNSLFVSQNNSARSKEELCHSFKSDVMYGFCTIAGLGVFLVPFYLFAKKAFENDIIMNQHKETEDQALSKLGITDVIYLFVMMIYITVCGSMIFVYGQFLPTFGIHSKLHASPKTMANMSISFYACMMTGRLLGTLCSLIISQAILMDICIAGSIMVSVMLTYVSEIGTTWLWIGTSILAVVCAPVLPAVQIWALDTNEHRNILYGISSILFTVGYAVMSLLTGQLMASISVQILNKVMLVVSLVQLLLIMLLYLIVCSKVKSEK